MYTELARLGGVNSMYIPSARKTRSTLGIMTRTADGPSAVEKAPGFEAPFAAPAIGGPESYEVSLAGPNVRRNGTIQNGQFVVHSICHERTQYFGDKDQDGRWGAFGWQGPPSRPPLAVRRLWARLADKPPGWVVARSPPCRLPGRPRRRGAFSSHSYLRALLAPVAPSAIRGASGGSPHLWPGPWTCAVKI